MSRQWGDQLRTGRESLRQAQRSDVRPRSVDRRVLRSEDQLFTYDDEDIRPVGDRTLIAQLLDGTEVDVGSGIVEQGTDANGPYITFSTGAKIAYDGSGVLQLTL